jgi:phospholipid/cholesterol/gamma-HCH transport system permease protein
MPLPTLTTKPGLAFDHAADATFRDSSLLTFPLKVSDLCREQHVAVERNGLPTGVRRLLALADAVPERAGARQGI